MKTTTGILLSVLLMAGCSQADPKSAAKPSDPKPVKPNATAKVPAPSVKPLIIDVRSQGEWDGGHLKQAIHIPHTEIADRIAEHTKDKNRQIILYCKSGGRAGRAASALKDLGYTQVENAGGYDDIKQRFE
jgi:phage shock protein E